MLLALVALLLAVGCNRADRPNFSGSWELDVAQSNFGPMPGPTQSTQVIEHNEPLLRLTADSAGFMGESHVVFEFVTDGSEKVQTVENKPRKTHTYWDDAVLVTEWEIDNAGQPRFQMVERRSLSADGRTLTLHRRVDSAWAKWEQTAVFVRKTSEPSARALGGAR
jgi:hypothetical protein